MVDYVLIDPDPTPLANLKLIQPDYFAKGYEYTAGSISDDGVLDIIRTNVYLCTIIKSVTGTVTLP